MMETKTKRKPFTEAEKEVIYSTVLKAKAEGKDLKAVKMYLADELDASFHTVNNTYSKMRRELQVASQETVVEFEEAVIEDVERAQISLELSEESEELHTEEKEESIVPVPSASVSTLGDSAELIKIQMSVLVDKIEKLTTERDEWKNKALALEAKAIASEAERKAIITLLTNKE